MASTPFAHLGSGVRLARNVVWNFGGQGWSLVLALACTPYIVRRLGTDAYGLLITVGIVTDYFWFMNLGLGQATVKYIAEHAAAEDWEQVRRIFWASATVYAVLGTLAALGIVAAGSFLVDRWLNISPELHGVASSLFRVSAMGVVLGMLSNAVSYIPNALQRFDLSNKVAMGVGTLQTLTTVGVLAAGLSVREVIIGNVSITAVALLANALIARRLVPRLWTPTWHRPSVVSLLRFASLASVSRIVGPVLENLEKVVLANRLSMAAVTYYTLPYNLTSKLAVFPSAVTTALFPAFSALHAKGFTDRTGRLNLRASRYVVLMTLPVVILMTVGADEMLGLWLGPDFVRESATTLRLLAFSVLLNAVAWVPFALLQASGRPDLTARIHVAELVVHVPLTFGCVWMWGVPGAALAWLVRAAIDTLLLWAAAVRLTGIRYLPALQAIFNRAVWAMLAMGLVLWAIKPLVRSLLPPLGLFGALGMAVFVLTCIVVWPWGLEHDERRLVRQALRREALETP